jgi:SAM-dependent methyltransferase
VVNLYSRALGVLCAVCIALAAAPAFSAPAEADYKPRLGQPGRDVVWIPTPDDMVEKMLDMARVTPRDFVVDLGSGDGRNVIAAARRGARALGVEYNPDLVELSRRNAAAAGVAERATFVRGDMFQADISKATALILFLIPDNLDKLRSKFLELEPGARIVSNTYEIGGGWEPEHVDRTEPCAIWCVAYLYIVPARVAGTWRLGDAELTLEQSFQRVTGTFELGGIRVPIGDGKLTGDEIRFRVNAVEYTGRVAGDHIEGVARGRTASPWQARRARD